MGSVCVATLLFALIPAVLAYCTVMYCCPCGFFASALAAQGTFSLAHGELSSSVLYGDLSSVHGGLPGLRDSHGLHSGLSSSALYEDLSSVHGGSPWTAGGHWGCLSASCLALNCWGWISLVVHVLLIMSPSPPLWLVFCLK